MTEPKFSRTERRIVDAMLEDKDKVWEVEFIAEVAYEGKKWPEYWQSSISAIMRSIMLKTMHSRARIVRTSELGRGNVAVYGVKISRPTSKQKSGRAAATG